MPIYEYRCDHDGAFELIRPLGTAPAMICCSTCGGEAKRVFSAPMIRNGSRKEIFAAIDRAEKSRHEPDVVSSVPSIGATRQTGAIPVTPALRRLPRP